MKITHILTFTNREILVNKLKEHMTRAGNMQTMWMVSFDRGRNILFENRSLISLVKRKPTIILECAGKCFIFRKIQ